MPTSSLKFHLEISAKPEPADVADAVRLREALRSFNHDALTRSTIGDADRSAVDHLRKSSAAFSAAHGGAGSSVETRREIAAQIARYLRLATGTHSVEFGTELLDLPLIESETVRGLVHALAERILTTLDMYIAARRLELQLIEAQRAMREAR